MAKRFTQKLARAARARQAAVVAFGAENRRPIDGAFAPPDYSPDTCQSQLGYFAWEIG